MRVLVGVLVALGLVFGSGAARADMALAQQAYADGNFAEALELWQVEARGGNADAAWYAGNMLIDGIGIFQPNPQGAVEFYQLAVDQGHTEAQVSLGLLYTQGRGVDEDYNMGMELLYTAAEAGHPVAQVELANYFLYGVPSKVEQSEGHAFEWYGLAARQGVILAQLRFGQLHYMGVGAPENQEEGLMWVSIARAVAQDHAEPYWSRRVFPLDADMISDGVTTTSLRDALNDVYRDMVVQMPIEVRQNAEQAALAWIAERSEN